MAEQNAMSRIIITCTVMAVIIVWQADFFSGIAQFALAMLGIITGIALKPTKKSTKYIAIAISILALAVAATTLNLLPRGANNYLMQISNNTAIFAAPVTLIAALKIIKKL